MNIGDSFLCKYVLHYWVVFLFSQRRGQLSDAVSHIQALSARKHDYYKTG